MGKQVSTLKMVGSFAGAVGYIDKQGRVQMRSKPEKVSDPNTKKQREVRLRFLAISTVAQGMKNVLLGLTPQAKAKRISLRNTFVKYNYAATEGTVYETNGDGTTDFTMVKLSMGPVGNPSFGTPTSTEPLQIDVAVSNVDSDPESTSDNAVVYVVAYNPALNKAIMAHERLGAGTISINVPNSWNGEDVKVYGFVQRFDSKQAREEYESIFNNTEMAGGESRQTIYQLQSNAEYSNSRFLGEVNIS